MPASNCSARGTGQRGSGRRGGSFRRLGVHLPSRNVVCVSTCGFFLLWGSLGPGSDVPPPPSPFFSRARIGASGGGGGGGKGFYFFSSAERRQRLACSLPVIKRPPARLSPALCCAAKLQTCRFLLRGPGALPAAATAAPPARPGRSPCASAALAGVSGRARRCLLPHAPYGRRPFNCSSPWPCPLRHPPRLTWGDASARCLGTRGACCATLPLGPTAGVLRPPRPVAPGCCCSSNLGCEAPAGGWQSPMAGVSACPRLCRAGPCPVCHTRAWHRCCPLWTRSPGASTFPGFPVPFWGGFLLPRQPCLCVLLPHTHAGTAIPINCASRCCVHRVPLPTAPP